MPGSRDGGTKFAVGGENDLSAGPVASRRCTDFVFLLLFLAHVAAFWVFSLWHAPHGDARKLYFPRDYKGQYCGLEDQADLADFGHLIYTLDLSETIDPIAYKFLCSTQGVEAANLAGVRGSDYIALCSSVSSQPLASFQSELANFKTYAGVSVTLSSGIEGSGENVLAEVDKYFNKVCARSCDVSIGSQSTVREEARGSVRNYLYMPAGDVPWYSVWKQIAENAPSSLEEFVFRSLPMDQCPYEDPKYCVPLPGVTFAQSSQGYCTFKVESALLTSLTETTVEYLDQAASSSLARELTGTADLAFGAIATTWDTFVIVSLLAFSVGLVFLVLLRFFVRPLVWGALIAVFVILVAGGFLAYSYSTECAATHLRASAVSDTLDDPFKDDPCGGLYRVEDGVAREVLRYAALVLWCLAMLYAIFAVCIIHHIKLAIAMNVVAAEFIYDTPHVFAVPVVQTLGAIAWTATWMVMATLLLSQVPSDYVTASCFSSYDSAHETCVETRAQAGFVWKDESSEACISSSSSCCWKCAPSRYAVDFRFFFSLFSFFWHHAFTVAVGQCIIAGAVGVWFFDKGARGSSASSLLAVRTSIRRCFRFHLGSLAFGSLIAALIQTARLFTRDLAAQAQSQRNRILEVIFTALSYFFSCFEKLVKFLGTGAYVQVALLGQPLCPSAQNAILLFLRNMVRFRVLAALGAAIHFIGSLLMAGFTGLLGFLILEAMHPETKMPVVLVSIYAALGFICGTLFMNVFRLAVDTTLQCFLATEEMNIDKDFIPQKLQALVNVTARAEEEECGSTRPCLARCLRGRKNATADPRKGDGQENSASGVSSVKAHPSREEEASGGPSPSAVSPKASSEVSSPESPQVVAV